jgi:hypothetical protein
MGGAQYSATILGDKPIGYWRLGESDPSLPAADATPDGNNGTYVGAVTLGQPGAILGDTDTAAAFDGSSTFVDIPSATGGIFDLSANFSLAPPAAKFSATVASTSAGATADIYTACAVPRSPPPRRQHTGSLRGAAVPRPKYRFFHIRNLEPAAKKGAMLQ